MPLVLLRRKIIVFRVRVNRRGAGGDADIGTRDERGRGHVSKGTRCLCGAAVAPRSAAFVSPTVRDVISHVSRSSKSALYATPHVVERKCVRRDGVIFAAQWQRTAAHHIHAYTFLHHRAFSTRGKVIGTRRRNTQVYLCTSINIREPIVWHNVELVAYRVRDRVK